MKKSVIFTSIVAGIWLLSGCGDTGLRDAMDSSKQPHEKTNRTFQDWTWNVGADITLSDAGFAMTTTYYSGMPDTTKHTQLFLDTTPNKGFNGSDGWEIFGADYLIEDDNLYQSLSDTKWKWKYLGTASTKTLGSGNDKWTIFTTGSMLAKAINSKKIDVYLETYDKDWNGAFKTVVLKETDVSGEVVSSPKTAKALIQAQLGADFLITTYLPTSDATGAIVLSANQMGNGINLSYYDISQVPKLEKTIDYVTHGDIYNVKLKDTTTFTYDTYNDNNIIYHVTYDFNTKKVISRVKVDAVDKQPVIVSAQLDSTFTFQGKVTSTLARKTTYIYDNSAKVKKVIITESGKADVSKEVDSDYLVRLPYERKDTDLYGKFMKSPRYISAGDKKVLVTGDHVRVRVFHMFYNDKGQVIEKRSARRPLWSLKFTYDESGRVVQEVLVKYQQKSSETYITTYTWGTL